MLEKNDNTTFYLNSLYYKINFSSIDLLTFTLCC